MGAILSRGAKSNNVRLLRLQGRTFLAHFGLYQTIERPCICHELCCFALLSKFLLVTLMNRNIQKLECGPMPNVMVALPNIGGALCSTPHGIY